MIFLKILRYIIGYVDFSATGGFADRFLNLSYNKGIQIKDVKLHSDIIYGSVAATEYRKLMSIARQSGVRLRAEKKYGLLFFVRKNKHRTGLVLGLILTAFFLLYTSSFIWTVEVEGAERTPAADVIRACEKLGLDEGVRKKDIDTNELSRLLIMELSGKVSWISVNVKGTMATVELRDYEEWREDKTYGKPSNIVADFDGLLMTVEVYNGVKIAKEGNGVKTGDLLISGIAENRDTSSQFMEARGKVTARHKTFTETTQKNDRRHIYKELEQIRVLKLFSLEIPLGKFSEDSDMYDEFENKKSISYGNTVLPVSLSVVSRVYYGTATESESYNICSVIDKHTMEMYEKFKNTLLLTSESKIEKSNGILRIRTENECVDFMGVKEDIYVE